MQYEIVSFKGVGPIKFGMSEDAVVAILGEPKERRHFGSDGKQYRYGDINVMFDQRGVVNECTFMSNPDFVLVYKGEELDWDGQFIPRLCELDGRPLESLGYISLYSLGLMIIDFFDKDTASVISVLSREVAAEAMHESEYDEPVDVSELKRRMKNVKLEK